VTVAGLSASFAAINTSWRVRAVETRWPDLLESLEQAAGDELDASLAAAVETANILADSAMMVAEATPSQAFRRLADAIGRGGPERGVVLLDSLGLPVAWAGRHRLEPVPGGPLLNARMTPFYVVLEAQRQTGSHIGVGQVLLAADSAIPDRSATLAELFMRRTGAALEFFSSSGGSVPSDAFDYKMEDGGGSHVLFSVRPVLPDQGAFKLELEAAGGRWTTWLMLGALAFLVACGPASARWLGVVAATLLLAVTPAGNWLGLGQLFSVATYYLDVLGPVSASAGSLMVTSALGLVALVPIARRGVKRHGIGIAVAVALVLAFPFTMEYLASGVTPPTSEIGLGLWLSWETTLSATAAFLLLATAVLVRGKGTTVRPPWISWVASGWAVGLAVLGLVVWHPVTRLPTWYTVLWLPAVLMAVAPATRARMVATVAVVCGAAAATLTWSAVAEGTLLLAERDAARASEGDPDLIFRLARFGETIGLDSVPKTSASLYRVWRRSPLSEDDYPAVLASWGPDGRQHARLDLAQMSLSNRLLQAIAESARDSAVSMQDHVVQPPSLYVQAVPFEDSSVVTVGVGPRSRLIEPVRLARFLRGERRLFAPYSMVLSEPGVDVSRRGQLSWRRVGFTVRGELVPVFLDAGGEPIDLPGGERHLHVQIPLSGIGPALVRGVLLVCWNALLIGLLWFAGEALTGKITVPPALRETMQLRSYRSRLTIALAGFFVLPTLGYAAWSFAHIQADAAQQGDLLIQETLSDAIPTARTLYQFADPDLGDHLTSLAQSVNADLLWYDRGVLRATSPEVLSQLGLVNVYLPTEVHDQLALRDELDLTSDVAIAGQATRVGYRNLPGFGTPGAILAVPRLVDVQDILSDQEDLLYLLALATLIGLAAAVLLAGRAAKSLARPVRSLRSAAVAVGRGDPLPPFEPDVPTEFVPVVKAFERMASDVEASQSALETARRRTAAVLRNVATAVVAVDPVLRVTIANPRAEQLLGAPLPAGAHVYALGGSEWTPVWEWLREFIKRKGDAQTREFVVGAKQIRAHTATIRGQPGGCVLALDDTTELTRAVRILAWGELARQVAHEIKNPLTPIRLGIQHLKRTHKDRHDDFEATLERTAKRILAEIERLDAIARAFARFGAPPAEAEPLADADLGSISQDTAELYALADGPHVEVEDDGAVFARVRKDEVKEVLVNLIENARDAGATEVRIAVSRDDAGDATVVVGDNGGGIAHEVLPLVFEPQFSTTTSGTGLGLAICKRLVESWGGTIQVESELGRGTAVRIAIGG
jgi:signal transduction histidine kinase